MSVTKSSGGSAALRPMARSNAHALKVEPSGQAANLSAVALYRLAGLMEEGRLRGRVCLRDRRLLTISAWLRCNGGAPVVPSAVPQPEILRIWATADAENVRSHKVLERLGLHREGVLPMATYRPNIGGQPRATAVYAWCNRDVNGSPLADTQGQDAASHHGPPAGQRQCPDGD
jgi:hypothetical protein